MLKLVNSLLLLSISLYAAACKTTSQSELNSVDKLSSNIQKLKIADCDYGRMEVFAEIKDKKILAIEYKDELVIYNDYSKENDVYKRNAKVDVVRYKKDSLAKDEHSLVIYVDGKEKATQPGLERTYDVDYLSFVNGELLDRQKKYNQRQLYNTSEL